jgi:hypothetical protein
LRHLVLSKPPNTGGIEFGGGMGANAWDQPSVMPGRTREGVDLPTWSAGLDRLERGERLGSGRILCWVKILQLVALAGLGVTVFAVLAL